MRACNRSGFSIAELAVATVLFVIIMGISLLLVSGSGKDREDLKVALEANERVLKAFDRMSEEVFEASVIDYPPVLDPQVVPPPFVHRSPVESTGHLAIVKERPIVNEKANGIDSLRERVHFYLDRPVRHGLDTQGAEVLTYSLFRAVEGTGPGSKPIEIVDGITELVFYRVAAFNAADQRGGSGPALVHVILKAATSRARPDKKLGAGYHAEFRSCFVARGKDIATRKADQQGGTP